MDAISRKGPTQQVFRIVRGGVHGGRQVSTSPPGFTVSQAGRRCVRNARGRLGNPQNFSLKREPFAPKG